MSIAPFTSPRGPDPLLVAAGVLDGGGAEFELSCILFINHGT